MHKFFFLSLLSALLCFFSTILQAGDHDERFVSRKHKEIAGYDVHALVDRLMLKGQKIPSQTHSLFPQAYLEGAEFRGDFFRAKLNGADLRNADLRNADFTGADFSYADLTGALFNEGTILDNVNFYGAKLYNIIVQGEVDFSNIRDEPIFTQIGLEDTKPIDYVALFSLGAKVKIDKIEKSSDSYGRKMGDKMRGSWNRLHGHKRTPSGSRNHSPNESPLKKSPSGKISIADSPRPALIRIPSAANLKSLFCPESTINENP